MAKLDINGVDDFIKELEELGKFEEIAPAMLEEAVPILEKEVVIQSKKHWKTGDMTRSIKRTGVCAFKSGGYYICVRPTGKDRKGVRNMEKAVYLEYGTNGRSGTPIITSAVLNAESSVLDKMQEVFERETGAK